ncbi:MAG: hypothetical protein UU11_C0013G0009 [Parcubacteria group bacterium GW2011_GWF2_40_69]|uniref:Uncharacterized protein n=1 Tax=Candidatus Nomurabacteria bacterium GWB1_40_6 TaxID=1801727 RepID=A0A1F6TKL5_9BACT|nr:MAG: hypothetical protein UT25_C0008G0009 [Parcubacteria group bacterium GW2011_GWC1_39_12]KKR18578.1 MAG: hypothetical protein UT49_C0007G0010 [Parcubacteria group bacterium GW2011_GWF1_39_37]KKR34705.1 MAG: hypothetical protein UT68_C0010G0009 [Parcubacteria group bacterium GW2011_GWC2_40_10]KKR51760.1 MAG: hypothetical protein UT89_C0008G0010 [Parcubacteria group bacterium GW2011_GWE1_40_20]KKR68409.1 MAG: hypothetical protein UU11_C0013G0009 [Parcubacteria group bacterium GW2011_GWF2_40_
MKDFSQKIKLFYVGLTKKESVYKRRGIKPTRDWLVILTTNLVLFCILGVFGFYFYTQINKDKLFITEKANAIEVVRINTGLLKKTVEDIHSREEQTTSIKNNGTVLADPSI